VRAGLRTPTYADVAVLWSVAKVFVVLVDPARSPEITVLEPTRSPVAFSFKPKIGNRFCVNIPFTAKEGAGSPGNQLPVPVAFAPSVPSAEITTASFAAAAHI